MWQKVCEIASLPRGHAAAFPRGSETIGIFHTEEGLYAVDNRCPHQNAALHLGTVENGTVYCPLHAWSFHLRTGHCDLDPSFNLSCFPVKIEEGYVWVDPERKLQG